MLEMERSRRMLDGVPGGKIEGFRRLFKVSAGYRWCGFDDWKTYLMSESCSVKYTRVKGVLIL